jgi:hypothetical protein
MAWAVRPHRTGTADGWLTLMDIQPANAAIEIGNIYFSPRMQRTRAATEAMFLLMRHAMDDLGYRRLLWKCNALNAPSRAAAARLGFVPEGVLRANMVVKGRRRDTAMFSILEDEWPARRDAIAAWLDDANFGPDGAPRRPCGASGADLGHEGGTTMRHHYRSALVVGAGDGLSASVGARLRGRRMRIGLARAQHGKLAPLAAELRAESFACDASRPAEVEAMFKAADAALGGPPEVVVYNPSARVRGPLVELDPEGVANALAVTAYGGFLVAQAAARRMLPRGQGAVLFTGASGEREGLRRLRPLRHGQVRAARAGAEHGARAGAQGHPRRALRHRRRHPRSAAPGRGGGARQHASIRTRSRALTSTCSNRTGAPGPGRSNCGLGGKVLTGPGGRLACPDPRAGLSGRGSRPNAAGDASAGTAGRAARFGAGSGPCGGAGRSPGGVEPRRARLPQPARPVRERRRMADTRTDEVGAFVPGPRLDIPGAADGPLAGSTSPPRTCSTSRATRPPTATRTGRAPTRRPAARRLAFPRCSRPARGCAARPRRWSWPTASPARTSGTARR